MVYVVVCRCVRFGICSGAAPAGFGIDHPVSGRRRLAGHYPFCVSLSVRAVTCTRRVACLFSSASRACGLPFWGDMGVRACVRAASSRASCLRRVRACAAWRPLSLLRGVAPVRAASLHFPQCLVVVVVLLALDIRGICFGSSLCLVTSFGGFVSGMRLSAWAKGRADAGWTEGGWTVGDFAAGNYAGAYDKCSSGFWRRSACAGWLRLNVLDCSRRLMRRFARAGRQIIYGTWPRCVVMFGIPIWLCCSCTNLFF